MTQKNLPFYEWLAGKTDGDGCFYIGKTREGWALSFQISLSVRDIQLQYRIKKELGVGTVSQCGESQYVFRIRRREHQQSIVIPIFDRNTQLTIKYYDFILFKTVLGIQLNNDKSKSSKNEEIDCLVKSHTQLIKEGLKSPYWAETAQISSKYWLLGFTEAEGSFYIVKKDEKRYCHGFGITQKYDSVVQESIKAYFHIKANVKFNRQGFYSQDTTNSRSIENIIKFYKGELKGCKSLEYSIWARAYRRNKGDYEELKMVQEKLRKLRASK